VGLGRGQALPDRLCVLFCFRVPACGFCLQVQSRSRGVKESRSPGVGCQKPTARFGPQAGRRRVTPRRLECSTSRLQNRGNKARMSMKTKDKYKKSGSADRRFCGLRLFHGRWGEPRTANTAVRATPESREQSENVYENKGQVQKVAES
jgi:hypothetical protein